MQGNGGGGLRLAAGDEGLAQILVCLRESFAQSGLRGKAGEELFEGLDGAIEEGKTLIDAALAVQNAGEAEAEPGQSELHGRVAGTAGKDLLK